MVKEDDGILNRQSLLTLRVYFHGYQSIWYLAEGEERFLFSGADLEGGSRRGAHPLSPQDDLRISNTTAIL